MNPQDPRDAMLEELWLDVEQLCRLADVDVRWVRTRVDEGLVATCGHAESGDWRFDVLALRRVQRMVRLERDFDAVPELAALVADLEEEIRSLRTQLQRRGVPGAD